MRHRKARTRLGRTSEHRAALMKNLAGAIIEHGRIHTTQIKAEQLRPYVEKLVTLAKTGDTHSRRLAFSRLGNKEAVTKLFEEIGPRAATRNGGFLRIIKDGPRHGDGALTAYIEFVDSPEKPEGDDENKAKSLKQRMHERRKEMAKARR